MQPQSTPCSHPGKEASYSQVAVGWGWETSQAARCITEASIPGIEQLLSGCLGDGPCGLELEMPLLLPLTVGRKQNLCFSPVTKPGLNECSVEGTSQAETPRATVWGALAGGRGHQSEQGRQASVRQCGWETQGELALGSSWLPAGVSGGGAVRLQP